MSALADAVRSGRALYAGISNYDAAQTRAAGAALAQLGVPLLIHQPNYNMFEPLGRARPAAGAHRDRRRLHPVLAAGPGAADQPLPARHSRRFARRPPHRLPQAGPDHARRCWPRSARSTRSRARAARPWPSWPRAGCCAAPRSPPCSSAPAGSRRSRTSTPVSRSPRCQPTSCRGSRRYWPPEPRRLTALKTTSTRPPQDGRRGVRRRRRGPRARRRRRAGRSRSAGRRWGLPRRKAPAGPWQRWRRGPRRRRTSAP